MAEARKPVAMVKRGGPGGPRAMGPMGKPDGATIKRLLGYIFKDYKFLVLVCIILNALAGVVSSLFLQKLIDDYITPLIGTANPVFTPLLKALGIMAVIYLVGIVSGFAYNRIMVTISQGVQKP